MDYFAIIANTTAIILAVLAIVLSIIFYRWSEKASRKIETASRDISHNVERLDGLFERFYSDTFSLVKDTFSDMRDRLWNENPAALREIEFRSKPKDESTESPVGRTIDRKEYIRKNTIKMMLPSIFKGHDSLPAHIVVDRPMKAFGFDLVTVVQVLQEFKEEGAIYFEGEVIYPYTVISIKQEPNQK